ncbi:ESCRT-0 subunit protein hse1 [Podila epigama]|nr:ESCRT-0 subunit protein hse1 [Podila epigama]
MVPLQQLCESLAKNCGLKAQREISSRAFSSLLVKILNEKSTHPAVRHRILELIQQWAFEFRADPSLGIMDETYQQLRMQSKFKFPSPQKPKKELKSEADKRKEEEELQLALALSLSASEHSAERKSSSSTSTKQHPEVAAAPVKRVRALYDFEPTEAGELGFQKDDIIVVLATSYQDWWKGELYGRQGIFPVNYVEEVKEGGPSHDFGNDDEAHVLHEAKNINGLIQILSNVDPRRDNFSENETLQDTYNNVLSIRPKLVELIKKQGEKKDELLLLNEKLTRARATYEMMMEQSIAKYSQSAYTPYQPQYQPGPGFVQNGQQYSTAPFQQPTHIQDPRLQVQYTQAQMPLGQQSQHTPYQPQLQQPQLQPQLQQQQQPQVQQQQQQQQPPVQQQQLTFDQAYAPQAVPQSQEFTNQLPPLQQPGSFAPQQALQQPQQLQQQQQQPSYQTYQQTNALGGQQGYAPQQQPTIDNQAAPFIQQQPQFAP